MIIGLMAQPAAVPVGVLVLSMTVLAVDRIRIGDELPEPDGIFMLSRVLLQRWSVGQVVLETRLVQVVDFIDFIRRLLEVIGTDSGSPPERQQEGTGVPDA